jgi:hypothetical protein
MLGAGGFSSPLRLLALPHDFRGQLQEHAKGPDNKDRSFIYHVFNRSGYAHYLDSNSLILPAKTDPNRELKRLEVK